MKAARLYAQVLVDFTTAPNSQYSLAKIKAELQRFAALFVESPLLDKAMSSPTISEEEKTGALKQFSEKMDLSALTFKFLTILVKRGRTDILSDIVKEIDAIEIEKEGGLVGEIVSAVPLDSGIASGVAAALSKKLNKPVQLKEKVDPGVIAGMRVTISGVTYDGSVKNKIEKLVGSFRS